MHRVNPFSRFGLLSRIGIGTLALLAMPMAGFAADCTIPETSCYPWRIDKGNDSTVLMEILPNNVVTSANYRVCVCPPASGVGLTMDFEDKKVEIGKVELNGGGTICRDYRVMSSRRSRLMLSRTDGNKDVDIHGCYN